MATSAAPDTTQLPLDIVTESPCSGKEVATMFEVGYIAGARWAGATDKDIAAGLGRQSISCVHKNYWLWSPVSTVFCKLNNNKNQKSVSEKEKMEEIEEADAETPAAETGVIMAGVDAPMVHFEV